MGNIVLLDELTINQIAAGEVIERPASVIKEMVENSIDAGASIINVEIKNGGISYIRISDNGKGIAKDDVELAFERHATSKIRSATDLQDVKSMGFRGEALASIAAIANVELTSRTENEETGTKIIVEGGNILNIEEVGCSKGTVITVRNLFFNTPVRYKFLKKDYTETGYIEDVVKRIALVHPEIAIKLINTGKTVMQTNGSGDLKQVIYSIYGKDIAEEIIPVTYEYEYIRIEGVIGKPAIARSNRSNQLFFVNKRYVKDMSLTSGAEQAFKGLLPIGKFGFIILNLEMNPKKVDVNVHPAKLEVRFEEEGVAFKSVYHAIKNALETSDLISDREKNREAKELSKDAFKIDLEKYTTGGLFGKGNVVQKSEIQSDSKLDEVGESNVFERLKKLQNELKSQVESNPKIELSNEYKKMQEKYNEIAKVSESINKELDEKMDAIKNKIVPEINDEKVQEKFEDADIENVTSALDKIKKDIYDAQSIDKVKETNEEIPSEEINEEVVDEVKEEIQQQKIIEDVNEKIVSFEEMYKQLFGKEPYSAREKTEQVEEVKEEENEYKINPNELEENMSVFEEIEEYKKPVYKFIGIAFKTYIILEMDNELYIMDQHAAHERLLYEKVKANYYKDGEKDCQMLLLPDIIKLSTKEMDIARDNLELFRKSGFDVEEFGENTIKLSGVPEMCIDLETKELFLEALDEINTVARTAKQEKEEKFLATVACKAAVKANMALTEEEVTSLMEQLLNLQNPFTCPHGRPTVIKMSKYDIERKFARK